ncbi:interferon-inducible GTPase 1-like [Ruditapes philippinarum]|uniref:interferon-inducible GTPase 1-like n=1 Tax=Ruditapes philippinarum TaxID=129788 RepID=UPI00295AD0D4|nr:interferon-inducible GTPase 1-like [Ruditapes philippinarum]
MMWWINFCLCLFLVALIFIIFRSIDLLLQTIPSKIETERVKDVPVKQLKETGAAKQDIIKKRKRVLDSDNSSNRKSVISEPSVLTDEQSQRESIYVAIKDCSQISSDYISEETEICKDEKGGALESGQSACRGESNSSIEDLEFDKFRSFVDDELLKEEIVTLGVLHGLNKYIKDSFDKWAQLELNIAVSGNSGVGKSSLINALRKLKPTDEGAAAVDVVETTKEGCKYTYPENANVAIWDLPGLGTEKFRKDAYLEDMNFARFDVVLIVSAGRFLENDIWLGKELRAIRKNIIFVRTKIDIDLMNAKRDHPDTFFETACLDKIKSNLSNTIHEGGLPASVTGIYLVSSPERNKYDFTDLDKKLKDMLSIKGKAIRSILQQNVQKEVHKNQQKNKNGFGFQTALSVLTGFVPTQALTERLCHKSLSNIRTICQQRFCIDDNSLDKTANELKTSSMSLKGRLKSYKKKFNFKPPHFDILHLTRFQMPILGMFFSAHNAYVTTKKNINTMCDEMAGDELKLANERLDRLEDDLKPIK